MLHFNANAVPHGIYTYTSNGYRTTYLEYYIIIGTFENINRSAKTMCR